MTPDEILNVYYAGMTEVELQQRSVNSVVKGQMIQLGNRLQEVEGDKDHTMGSHNMAFRDPIGSDWQFYGRKVVTIAETIDSTLRHENRQYQWLLVEAYEQFEVFLLHLYAFVGEKRIEVWTQRERAMLSDSAAIEPSFDDCLMAVKAIARSAGAEFVLKSLRRILPQLEKLENKNATGASLLLSTNVTAQLRHHIVHTGGQVKDRETFSSKVFAKCGRSGHKAFIDEWLPYINSYFRYTNYPSTICLIKIPMDNFFSHQDVLQQACNLLLAHAYLATVQVKAYFDQAA